MRFARLLPKLITFEPPPCIWFIRKIQNPISSMNGSSVESERPPRARAGPLGVEPDVLGLEHVLVLDLRLRRRVVDLHLLAAGQRRVDLLAVRGEEHLLDPAVLRLLDQLRVRHVLALVAARDQRLAGEEHQQHDHHEREQRAAEEAIHRGRRVAACGPRSRGGDRPCGHLNPREMSCKTRLGPRPLRRRRSRGRPSAAAETQGQAPCGPPTSLRRGSGRRAARRCTAGCGSARRSRGRSRSRTGSGSRSRRSGRGRRSRAARAW